MGQATHWVPLNRGNKAGHYSTGSNIFFNLTDKVDRVTPLYGSTFWVAFNPEILEITWGV